MSRSKSGRTGVDWAVALALAAAVAVYLFRHRSLLADLPRLLEALV